MISINSLGQAFLTMTASIYGAGPDDLDAAYEALEKLKPIKLVDFTGSVEKMLLGGQLKGSTLLPRPSHPGPHQKP